MFFDRQFPGAVAIADPDGDLYRSFEVERGGLRDMFGREAWACGITAARRGYFINRKIGDPWTLPTLFAVVDGAIVWEHRGDHAGDHPDVAAIPDLIGRAGTR